MFTLNGSRRPKPTLTIFYKNSRDNYGRLTTNVHDGIREVMNTRQTGEFTADDFRSFFTSRKNGVSFVGDFKWKSTAKEFTRKSHEVLVSIHTQKRGTESQRGMTVNIYVLPKEMFDGSPEQKRHMFYAKLNPFVEVKDESPNKGPFIKVFKVINPDTADVSYVRSRSQAMHLSHGNMESVTTVDTILINGEYFEIKGRLPDMTEVDVNEFRLMSFDKGSRFTPKNTFEQAVVNLDKKVVFSKNITNFSDGIYRVAGLVSGVILVETVQSRIKGSEKYFLFEKEGSSEYKKLISDLKVIETV